MLRLENIIKNYESGGVSFPALKGINLAFRKSEFVSILGPSGCGKTTLLNIIGGLDHYTSGDLIIEGTSTKEYSSHDWDVYRNYRIGFIFQSYNLIPHQNIVENVELALTIAGYSKDEKRKKAMKALDMVGLKGAYKKMPNQLSGGQCQRVAIARALVNEPDILLGDEPTGALDSKTSVQVMKLIKKISKKKLVIMVTHNPPLAKEYSTRIISLLDGNVVGDTNPYKLEEEKKEKFKKFSSVKTGSKEVVHPSRAKMSFWDAFKLSAKNLISKKKRTMMVIAASSIGIVGVSAVLGISSGVKGFIATTQKDMLSGNPLTVQETSVDLVSILQNVSRTLQRQAISDSIKDGYLDIEYLTGALITQAKEGILITNKIDDNYVKFVNYGKKDSKNGIVDTFNNYGFSFANNIYTEAQIYEDSTIDPAAKESQKYIYSLSGIKNIYTGVLDTIQTDDDTDFTALANIAANFPNVLYQGLDNLDYIKEQYDLVATDKGSRWPGDLLTEEEQTKSSKPFECVVVLNRRKKLADLVVTLSGLLSEKQFLQVILEYIKTEPDEKIIEKLSQIAISEVLNKSFFYIPNGKNNKEGAFKFSGDSDIPFNYNYKLKKDSDTQFTTLPKKGSSETTTIRVADDDTSAEKNTTAKRIKIVGVITPKEGRNYGSLPSGIYFRSDLANKMMKDTGEISSSSVAEDSSDLFKTATTISNWLKYTTLFNGNGKYTNSVCVDSTGATFGDDNYGLIYPLSFARIKGFDKDGNPEFVTEPTGKKYFETYGTVGDNVSIIPHYTDPEKKELSYTEIKSSLSTRSMGGIKLMNIVKQGESLKAIFSRIPSSISVYSRDFQTKDMAKKYLETWNQKGDVRIGPNPGDIVPYSQRTPITVPDNLTIVISMINNIITTTTISLTLFASLSLVVSTVMIGIITYISVMERIKEIGVIRSLGGRKKDVSHLFNAETFILGTISGVFGIAVTYLFELIVDIIVYKSFRIPMIVDLKWYTALIMIMLSIVLTAISGLVPASSAANKDPVNALRTE